LFALLLIPTPVQAKAAPGLVIKTTSVTMTVSPMTASLIKTSVVFANEGSVPLRWSLYVGSDFGGCAVESSVKWLSISPTRGNLTPHSGAEAFLMVDARGLEPGTHNVLLCMSTNDPFHESVIIPFTVNVK
jgi:hypothetical protein